MVLIKFYGISFNSFHCSSKYLISLTHLCWKKLRAIVPNADYFTPIILKFKILIYNSNRKITHNFCVCVDITLSHKGLILSLGVKLFNIDIFLEKKSSKYAILMIELYACDNLNQIYRLFSFLLSLTYKYRKHCF